MLSERLAGILTTNHAETDAWADDPRLTGRTYAISFDRVWNACLELARRTRGWHILQVDDLPGFIRIRCTTLVFNFVDDLEIRVRLDENALTRVDLCSRSRKGWSDLGVNARRIGRFIRRLDRRLHADAATILDPTQSVSWSIEAG